MSYLIPFILAAILALPAGLSAQAGKASAPAGSTPVAAPASTVPADASATPQQANADKAFHETKKKSKDKKEKKPKTAKSTCVAPEPGSGWPNYCANPYWEPKDWIYLNVNGSSGLD